VDTRDTGYPQARDPNDREELALLVREHFEEHKPEPTSFPAMATRIMDLAEHPDVDLAKLAHLIERDPGVCTLVLKVANSALNRRGTPIANARAAITLLGLKKVANVAVGVACRALFDMEQRAEHEMFAGWWQRLFHSAMTEAFTCAFVSMNRTHKASDGIFMAGLLHDVGKTLALRSLAALMLQGRLTTCPDEQTIGWLLDTTRVEIGALALGSYNLPRELVDLCLGQDELEVARTETYTDLHIVRVVSGLNRLRLASALVACEQPGSDDEAARVLNGPELRRLIDSARALDLDVERAIAIAAQLGEHSAEVAALFSTPDPASNAEYLSQLPAVLSGAGLR
jgi:HD-like signal output (HDOD) protein